MTNEMSILFGSARVLCKRLADQKEYVQFLRRKDLSAQEFQTFMAKHDQDLDLTNLAAAFRYIQVSSSLAFSTELKRLAQNLVKTPSLDCSPDSCGRLWLSSGKLLDSGRLHNCEALHSKLILIAESHLKSQRISSSTCLSILLGMVKWRRRTPETRVLVQKIGDAVVLNRYRSQKSATLYATSFLWCLAKLKHDHPEARMLFLEVLMNHQAPVDEIPATMWALTQIRAPRSSVSLIFDGFLTLLHGDLCQLSAVELTQTLMAVKHHYGHFYPNLDPRIRNYYLVCARHARQLLTPHVFRTQDLANLVYAFSPD